MFNSWFKYKIFLVILACFLFTFMLWYSYYVYVDNTKEEEVPLIKAPTNLVFKPKDPGGMIVPDKDKDIYNVMSGRKSTTEKIKITKDASGKDISKAEAIALINKQIQQPVKIKTIKPIEVYFIRVAKIKTPDALPDAVSILKSSYKQLGDLKEKLYEEQSFGIKKYYVHFGPIKDKTQAESLCNELKNTGKACKVFSE